jgi:hypothetical protein
MLIVKKQIKFSRLFLKKILLSLKFCKFGSSGIEKLDNLLTIILEGQNRSCLDIWGEILYSASINRTSKK